MSDSLESTGSIETAVSAGEDEHLASHSGGDARLTSLETSLQAILINLSSLLTSRRGPSLGTETTETSLPLGKPSGLEGVPVSRIVHTKSHLPVTLVVLPYGMPAFWGHNLNPLPSLTFFLSLASSRTTQLGRSSGEQRVYPTDVEVIIENSQVVDRPMDVSMEEEGSEEQVLSTNSLPPLPLGDWIETLGLSPQGSLVLVDTRHQVR